MKSKNIGLDQWTRYIKSKTWVLEDVSPISHANNLIVLLNGIFPKKFQSQKFDLTTKNQLPVGFHFLYNNPPNISLGSDGYDNYQAPIIGEEQIYKRRMWVKGHIEVHESPVMNEFLKCKESIKAVRTLGDSTFVNIGREFGNQKGLNLIESRTLIYKNELYMPIKNTPNFPMYKEVLGMKLSANDVLRYSFLTYNCHKIHYDKNYCQQEENLPNIIVQGPFMVTILLYWFQKMYPNVRIKRFSYKNMEPWFVDEKVQLCCVDRGNSYLLQIINRQEDKIYIEGIAT